jgi:hypothetical protein
MPTEYVRGYQDQSGGSHMFALWTQPGEPDEADTDGWTWVMADKVTYLWRRHDSTWGKTVTVVCLVDFNCFLLTLAAAEDVRWGIDLALNGGRHRVDSDTTNEDYKEAALAGFLAAESLLKRERASGQG